jgi:phage terminase large subunit-like protein
LKLLRTWRGKLRKRGGQIGVISTAGEPGTEFEDARAAMKRAATDVTTGRDGCYLRAAGEYAVIHDFSVPSPDMAEDMAVVARTNPLSHVTPETLRKDRDDPTMTREHWLRFKCNIAVRGEDSAINSAEWAECGTSEVIPEGEPVDVGADFGWKHDTTAIVPLWQDGDRFLFGKPEILIPPRNGQILRPDEVKAAFERIHERNPIRRVVIDPDRAAEIAVWLEDDLRVEVVEYLQSNAADGDGV